MKHDNLENRLVEFSADIVKLTTTFDKSIHSKIITDQILRSGISVALNYGEARSAESRKDFIHKMRISLKELRETNISLRIINETVGNANSDQVNKILKETNELISIFVVSINTASKNLQDLKSKN